jgi:hypothetical protein
MTDTTHLAHSIPVGEIVNAGDEVFPVLRQHIRGNTRLLALIDERDRWGQAKYGQPLRTGDGRNTDQEIMGESLDLLPYITKKAMQTGDPRWLDVLNTAISLANDIIDTMQEVNR